MFNELIDRLNRLVQKEVTWQGIAARFPGWITGEVGEPYRPTFFLWGDPVGKWISKPKMLRPDEASLEGILNNLVSACEEARGRPKQLALKDPELAILLRQPLAQAGVAVVHREQLEIESVAKHLTRNFDSSPIPGLLKGQDVDIDKARAYADAAAHFYRSRLWEHLIDDDLIQIESPQAPPGLAFTCVMGAAGRTYGIAFTESLAARDRLMSNGPPASQKTWHWSLTYDIAQHVPVPDHDLWEDHAFALAAPDAYPTIMGYGPNHQYSAPSAPALAYVEGLLLALAQTTEDEIDTGRWEKTVQTIGGEITYVLSLPDLLRALAGKSAGNLETRQPFLAQNSMEKALLNVKRLMRTQKFTSAADMNQFLKEHMSDPDKLAPEPQTPLERAQDVMFEAFEARGRRQVQLARAALAICPDCADAYVMLAQRGSDPERARELFVKAVAAGERALGEEVFRDSIGHFWGITETRPYMRARAGLAGALEKLGRYKEATDHYREMLRLNPGDNQGIRYILLPALLHGRHLHEAHRLLDDPQYRDDSSAAWLYGRALLAFLREGNSAGARSKLIAAVKENPYVPSVLLSTDGLPESPRSYSPGSPDEADVYANEVNDLWTKATGALEWLATTVRELKKKKIPATSKKKKRR